MMGDLRWLERVALAALLIVGARVAPRSSQATGPPHRLALTHVTVFDGTGAAAKPDQTVVVEDSLVTAVFPTGSRSLPANATVLDLPGRHVIPGLIDTHVHVATDVEGEDTPARTSARLAAALYGGITSVREMAGDERILAGLARNAALGEIESPNIRYAALFAGPGFFKDPRTHTASRGAVAGSVPWMKAVTSATDLRQVVAEAKGSGATAVKLYAELDSALTARITTEAHRQGLLVWAHADLDLAHPADVVGAGVDAVSHADLFTRAMTAAETAAVNRAAAAGAPIKLESPELERVLQEMVRRGTLLDATLFVFKPAPRRIAAAVTRAAHRAGVLVTTGTDSLGTADRATLPNLHRELELLVTMAGFTPAEALVAATRNGARILGLAARTGTIEPGKWADLVVLQANPLADIRNTRRIELVVKYGHIYRRR